MRGPTLVPTWAARDVLRRPAEALTIGAALAGLIWVAGTVTLLSEAVRSTAFTLIDAGPALVVRRLGPAGFAPIPVAVTASVAAVPGALNVRPRIWGPARADDRAIEIVGFDDRARAHLAAQGLVVDPISTDQALTGPGFAPEKGAVMTVRGSGETVDLELAATLDDDLGLVAQDSFLVRPAVARRVLGLPPETATDIALDVFRTSEEAAIRADIAGALPFPVTITTRTEAKRRYATTLTRRGGLFLLMLLPAALAVCVLVAAAVRDRNARAKEVGLLKSLGWTTQDIVWMHGFRALWIAIPAVGMGWLLAWFSVFGPTVRWPGALLLGWSGPAPVLALDPSQAGVVLVEVTIVAVIPWLAASLAPAIANGATDPWALLSESQG